MAKIEPKQSELPGLGPSQPIMRQKIIEIGSEEHYATANDRGRIPMAKTRLVMDAQETLAKNLEAVISAFCKKSYSGHPVRVRISTELVQMAPGLFSPEVELYASGLSIDDKKIDELRLVAERSLAVLYTNTENSMPGESLPPWAKSMIQHSAEKFSEIQAKKLTTKMTIVTSQDGVEVKAPSPLGEMKRLKTTDDPRSGIISCIESRVWGISSYRRVIEVEMIGLMGRKKLTEIEFNEELHGEQLEQAFLSKNPYLIHFIIDSQKAGKKPILIFKSLDGLDLFAQVSVGTAAPRELNSTTAA